MLRLLLMTGISWCLGLVLCCDAAEPPKRVEPPKWSQDVLDAFFDDARTHLVGERPSLAAQSERMTATPAQSTGQPSAGSANWSQLVRAETLTSEIKRLNNDLNTALKLSKSNRGGGILEVRRKLGMLTVLFEVVAKFDLNETGLDDLDLIRRWQRSAQFLRSQIFQAHQECKAGKTQGLAATKDVLASLGDLLRGQAPTGEAATTADDPAQVVELPVVMQCMEVLLKEQLSPALANVKELRKRALKTAEQAQLLAVLAEVIQQQGYEYADDDTYLDESLQLREAARELSQAAQDKNYEAARAAAARVGKACSNCHEGYRG